MIHRLLQEAGERKLTAENDSIAERWERLIQQSEHEMRANWLERHLAPLNASVREFEVRRIQALRRAMQIAATASAAEASRRPLGAVGRYGHELTVATSDGLVRGRIDSVSPSNDGPIIQDFKSGAIFNIEPDRELVVKDEYRDQLRLYAALYQSSTGAWPARLELAPIAGPPEEVEFDALTCTNLLDESRARLQEVNRKIQGSDSGDLEYELASPSPEECRYCPFRPGCTPYRREREKDFENPDWPRDVWGRLASVEELGNGRLLLTLDTANGRVRIRGVTIGPRHPALALLSEGHHLAAFNLGGGRSHDSFSETLYTVLYKCDQSTSAADTLDGEGQ